MNNEGSRYAHLEGFLDMIEDACPICKERIPNCKSYDYVLSHLNAVHFGNQCPLCGLKTEYINTHKTFIHPGTTVDDFLHAFLLGVRP